MTETSELTCAELVELVTEYLEGTLPATDRARFEAHLAECGSCARYLAQMRITIHTLGHLSEESLAADERDRLLAAFRDWKSERGPD